MATPPAKAEVAEYVAAELLGLTLTPARTIGHDALRGTERIQIKGRAYGAGAKKSTSRRRPTRSRHHRLPPWIAGPLGFSRCSFCSLLARRLSFAMGMVTGLGIKTPFDYSVFSAAAAAFLLAFWEPDRFTLDKLLNRSRS
jgi:hypothetical protein